MSTLAVIPARGGSKGIPRKNLLSVAGKPLIVWTIEQALAVPGLRVAVSTEDPEIATAAAAAGAWVIARPTDLAQDDTATEPVVEHAIVDCTERFGRPDRVLLLQATSPVRRPGTIGRALAQFDRDGVDSLVGVVPTPPFIWSLDGDQAVAHWDWQRRARRQDMRSDQLRYRETGSLYVTRTDIYERTHNRMGGRIGLFVMDEIEGVDIDSIHDVTVAEAALARLGG
ncbi:cytidylyltransferase domain-containing protein [Tessaracoccus sp. O5.2]|uniref:acylneuraminate cytidylyltransferase family protein n=1 Tax=Tessaracoccus sp. O5.2 TaxID=3157622 RepID=UPI0036DBCA7D